MTEISLAEAIEQIMKRRKVSKRTAKRMILAKLRSGELPSTGYMVRSGPGGELISKGRREDIPAEFWRGRK